MKIPLCLELLLYREMFFFSFINPSFILNATFVLALNRKGQKNSALE
ncbi:hypothetical protein KIS4809_1418 [Bacillus sp. ZZV12-4809]|nr:hypothetical protein KIS4809_1418 [Bacillus sp. ZZV12-4809]